MKRNSSKSQEVVIVTGAGAGIGRGVAAALAAGGANVVLADIDRATIEQLAAELQQKGGSAIAVPTDVTKADEVDALVDLSLTRFGIVDSLVIAAGGFAGRSAAEEITVAQWDNGISLNLSSAFYCCRAVIPQMKAQKRGSIVIVASAAARTVVNPCTVYYAAAKSGLLGLTRHLAFELGEFGIRVNAVAPGTTMTPRISQLYDEARLEVIRRKTPLGRIADVDDQVGPIMFLLSTASAYMTGVTLDINGGRIMM